MHKFNDLQFPDADGDDVLKSIGIKDNTHVNLLTKFMNIAKLGDVKSRAIKNICHDLEFTDDEMKLIILLAYDRAVEHIQETAEGKYSK